MAIYNPPPTSVPTAHHTTHETGGADAVTALSGSIITTGTIPDAVHSANIPRLNAPNVFTENLHITRTQGSLYLRDTTQSVDAKTFQIADYNQSFGVLALNDAESTILSTPLSLSRAGDASVGRDIFEKGRTTPIGHWIDVPYSAGNFTTNAGTWTVSAANVRTLCYALIGKTLVYAFDIIGTTVSGSPAALRIALPAGLGSASVQSTPFMYSDGAVNGTGMAQMSGAAFVALYKDIGGGTAWPNSGNTLVSGTMAIRMP